MSDNKQASLAAMPVVTVEQVTEFRTQSLEYIRALQSQLSELQADKLVDGLVEATYSKGTVKPLQADKWIPVSTEPKKDRNILLLESEGNISTGYLCLMQNKYIPDDKRLRPMLEITHWQPLPSPPEE